MERINFKLYSSPPPNRRAVAPPLAVGRRDATPSGFLIKKKIRTVKPTAKKLGYLTFKQLCIHPETFKAVPIADRIPPLPLPRNQFWRVY